jgi:hypothetical protein
MEQMVQTFRFEVLGKIKSGNSGSSDRLRRWTMNAHLNEIPSFYGYEREAVLNLIGRDVEEGTPLRQDMGAIEASLLERM